jgi:hypothetical protein
MESLKLLKELLGLFVNDIERGIDPKIAGWTERANEEVWMLVERGMCERLGSKVRIAFCPLPSEIVAKLNDDSRWLAEVHEEVIRAVTTVDEIERVIEDDSLRPAALFLGWKRMLMTSGFPVVVDRVLQEGFAPDGWTMAAAQASSALSLSVIKKWWDKKEVEEGLRRLSISEEVRPSQNAERVKRVLKWDVVANILRKDKVLTLGYLWFADFKIENFLYSESLTYIQKRVWETMEKVTRRNGAALRESIANVVEEREVEKVKEYISDARQVLRD